VILVTGTKRSGTSMWMQTLRRAGFGVLGEAFPGTWNETIREANPEGFYESSLRRGIYYATNPNPVTGRYIRPEEVRGVAVKVFVPGLVRSDLAFVERVIACVRDYRAYPASLERLYAMEDEKRRAREGDSFERAPALPPLLEWWADNFSLIADQIMRGYPAFFVTYENVLRDPHGIIREALAWLGVRDEARIEAACATVKPALNTQDRDKLPPVDLPAAHAEIFEGLYTRIRDRKPFEPDFLEALNALDAEIGPGIDEMRAANAETLKAMRQRRARARARRRPT
jgi:hypothetical protein